MRSLGVFAEPGESSDFWAVLDSLLGLVLRVYRVYRVYRAYRV